MTFSVDESTVWCSTAATSTTADGPGSLDPCFIAEIAAEIPTASIEVASYQTPD